MNPYSYAAGVALLSSLSCSALAASVTVTEWNFNSPTADGSTATGSHLPAIGSGTLSLIGGVTNPGFNSGVGSSDPAASDNSGFQTTSYAAQGTGDKSRGVQFAVSTVGYRDVVITYDLRHSNTSSRFEQVQYSTDGTTFIDIASFDGNAGDTWFNDRTVDLGAIAGVADNANFAFRIVAMFAPGSAAYAASRDGSNYSTSGTWRFDMVSVSASPVPVPAALPLFGSAALGLVFVRRRRDA